MKALRFTTILAIACCALGAAAYLALAGQARNLFTTTTDQGIQG